MHRHLLKASILVINSVSRTRHGGTLCNAFTGKLVKSLIIDANPKLKVFFEKSSGNAPKLIHVTPLYTETSKVKCVHNIAGVHAGERYSFYVGFIETQTINSPSFDDVYRALIDISGHHAFRDKMVDVELVSINTVDVDSEASSIVPNLVRGGKMRVIFSSPTLLRDPLKNSKYKSLTPTPLNIFSTPVYVNLYLSGRYRRSLFVKTLITLHRVLNEPYSVYRTAKIIKIRYDENKNPIPALIGYVNLFLNRDYYGRYIAKGLDIDTLLEETLLTMLTVGTGTSRATGFGHTIVVTPSGS